MVWRGEEVRCPEAGMPPVVEEFEKVCAFGYLAGISWSLPIHKHLSGFSTNLPMISQLRRWRAGSYIFISSTFDTKHMPGGKNRVADASSQRRNCEDGDLSDDDTAMNFSKYSVMARTMDDSTGTNVEILRVYLNEEECEDDKLVAGKIFFQLSGDRTAWQNWNISRYERKRNQFLQETDICIKMGSVFLVEFLDYRTRSWKSWGIYTTGLDIESEEPYSVKPKGSTGWRECSATSTSEWKAAGDVRKELKCGLKKGCTPLKMHNEAGLSKNIEVWLAPFLQETLFSKLEMEKLNSKETLRCFERCLSHYSSCADFQAFQVG